MMNRIKIVLLLTFILCLSISFDVLASEVNDKDTENGYLTIMRNAKEIENFFIHNDVMFNDSMNIAKEKETDAGANVKDGKIDTQFFVYGTIAGIDYSAITYDFYNDELYFSMYDFSAMDGGNYFLSGYQEDDFDKITEALIKKYGNPFFSYDLFSNTGVYSFSDEFYKDGDGIPFILSAYKENETVVGAAADMSKFFNTDMKKYNQWLLKTDDEHFILVDHDLFSKKISSTYYNHKLRYLYLDKETVASAFEDYYLKNRKNEKEIYDPIIDDSDL